MLEVVPNDENGMWDIHDPNGWIGSLESESMAHDLVRCYNTMPRLIDATRALIARLRQNYGTLPIEELDALMACSDAEGEAAALLRVWREQPDLLADLLPREMDGKFVIELTDPESGTVMFDFSFHSEQEADAALDKALEAMNGKRI